MRYLDAIRDGLAGILADDPRAMLLGEDIADPYGGAFKATRGLSTRFPDQVRQTPISEAGFVGVAAGLACAGYRPIVEIMFGDFLTLIADPVLNTAAKLNWLRPGRMPGGVLIRTPVGGRRGYGPIHSQSPEQLYFGWPDVTVLAPNLAGDPGRLLRAAFQDNSAVRLFLENKTDYAAEVWEPAALEARGVSLEVEGDPFPTAVLRTSDPGEPPDLVIAAYGGMAAIALEAAVDLLIEDEITCAVCLPSRVAPVDPEPVARWARLAGRLLTVEEGYSQAGWGAHLLGRLAGADTGGLRLEAVRCLGPRFAPIPADPAREAEHLPGAGDLLEAARALCRTPAAA